MRERQEGSYYGLGITIQVDRRRHHRDVALRRLARLQEGPPPRRRHRARSKGEDTKGWTTRAGRQQAEGTEGHEVNISLRRRGYDELIDMEVERDEVNITTVRGAFMIDNADRLHQARRFLRDVRRRARATRSRSCTAKGMKRLVFDLRDNPGGPLDQAIRISNRFLPRGDLIVYTRGRVAELRTRTTAATESQRLHARAARRAGQPQQRQRLGDRLRRAAGSRPRAGRRRDDVRQGARAVGLPDRGERRPGADDRPLLHAERPHDPASVGRRVRRVPDLHAARADRRTRARRPRT